MTIESPYLDKPSPWSSHSVIARMLKGAPSESKILDVGTATGVMARTCSDTDLLFYGIEPNSNWAKLASPAYKEVWVGTVENAPEIFLQGYDAIVLADILEHTSNPGQVLKKLISHQKAGARFYISVPNIANIWVRLNLLFGHFDYTDRGILDRTHLRFFTRKTIAHLVETSGLQIRSIHVTPIPLELISPFFVTPIGKIIYKLFANLTFLFPTLLGYQFIVEAENYGE